MNNPQKWARGILEILRLKFICIKSQYLLQLGLTITKIIEMCLDKFMQQLRHLSSNI